MIKLTTLGFGGWVSNTFFGQPSYILENENTRIMLDAGEGTYFQLRKCTSLDIGDISYIVLTHSHGDHILGIPTILQYAGYLSIKVRVVAPYYVHESIKRILETLQIPHYEKYMERITINEGKELQLANNISLKAYPAHHTVNAVSYRLSMGEAIIGYSGDTKPNPQFLKDIEGALLLIHEVSAPPEYSKEAEAYGHTSSKDIAAILRLAKPKYFMPTHYFIEEPYLPLESYGGVRLLTPAPCSTHKLNLIY